MGGKKNSKIFETKKEKLIPNDLLSKIKTN
jgi:hypothetical protein